MADLGYVDIEYADAYVSSHFVSTDPLRLGWEKLSEEDKRVLLTRSFEAIELMPFVGIKSKPDQPYSFPRYPDEDVPEAIKAAQVENAISLSDSSSTEDAAFYEKMFQFGIQSYSIGNLSENIGSGTWGRGSAVSNGIISTKATRLLQPYVGGGYRITNKRFRRRHVL